MSICCVLGMVNRQVDIAMAAEGIGLAGETAVLDGDALLAAGI